LVRLLEKEPRRPLDLLINPNYMPHHKTDINNNGPFSTDMIGMNYNYPDAGYEERRRIFTMHEQYTKGLLYFLGHDEHVPVPIRDEMLRWGYPKDEYADNNYWSPQMYIREARRMIGEYVMTQSNCEGREKVKDGVGMAAYTMDSHNCQRIVVEKNGVRMVKNEGDVQIGGFPPYPVSYRSLTPKETQCRNLLVPVCLSASHIAYGSIRMEPVFMVMGQSAAVAAILAIDGHCSVQRINVKQLQQVLKSNPLADNSGPDVLVDNEQTGNIRVTGNWIKNENIHNSYASSSLSCKADDKGGMAVKFIPLIRKNGKYALYSYQTETDSTSSTVAFNVFDGRQLHAVNFNMSSLKAEGQTSGEWVYLGTYSFYKNAKSYVEMTNKGPDGMIIADAILLVAQK
jgi:hypothetical protein